MQVLEPFDSTCHRRIEVDILTGAQHCVGPGRCNPHAGIGELILLSSQELGTVLGQEGVTWRVYPKEGALV